MSRPTAPRTPRWSVLLRVGIGFGVFGLFVLLFSFDSSTLGLGLFGIGVACVLASLVLALNSRPRR